ncbi:MAG TPA: N-acetylmuramoyl-L-alanine amidase [Bacillota bacterium]|nr:N-acetylmuramoyl-L-alanine amidase [Bacillota bacterium]
MKKTTIVASTTLFIVSFSLLGTLFAANIAKQDSSDVPSTTVPPASSTATSSPIRIVAPEENAHLPALAQTYVCGSVPEGGKLSINGLPVTVHPGGGFVTMVSLSPGEFKIKLTLQLGDQTYDSVRTIFVAAPEQPAPVLPLTIEWVTPSLDQELLPGDDVKVTCKGSPGMEAYFTVNGIRKKFPMAESADAPTGIYQGIFSIGGRDRLKNAQVKVTLVDKEHHRVSKTTAGTISIFPHDLPVMVQTISPDTVLKAGPAISDHNRAGYLLFPPVGTSLQITGHIGGEYRVRLNQAQSVWVNVDDVKRLPLGTPPNQAIVDNVSIHTDQNSTFIRIPLSQKIPFKVVSDGEKYLDLSLYGAYSNTDVIAEEAAGVVESVNWFQDDQETYRLRINTPAGHWWGYDTRYEGDDAHPVLVLELRTPPPVTADNSPLSGLTIAVDAGHGTGSGALGTTGYAEGNANMAMALNLIEKLQAKGAKVIMTRPGDEDIPLYDRPRIAWQKQADLLVSLHNNSYGYDGNPLLNHGFGVYYFTPMSLPLAKAVHDAYHGTFATGGNTGFNLPDNGLYYDNLALTRPTQMPSILIETAFMIVPEEEADLKMDAFRSVCSDAIIQGLEHYTSGMRANAEQRKSR